MVLFSRCCFSWREPQLEVTPHHHDLVRVPGRHRVVDPALAIRPGCEAAHNIRPVLRAPRLFMVGIADRVTLFFSFRLARDMHKMPEPGVPPGIEDDGAFRPRTVRCVAARMTIAD